jgi:NAD(P)-dependent dehydrogenase (short-subunit alcohol dehydrogenase family)
MDMTVQHDFNGQVAVVTGAGGGIGREIALHLARSNANVLAVDLKADGLRETVADSAGRIATHVCDLCESAAAGAVMDAAQKAFGAPLAILVNNAGLGNARAAHETSEADWDRYIDINLGTLFKMSVAALPRFAANGGCIVNMASSFGLVGVQGSAAYSAAKAGIGGLTRQMAAEYGPRGIRINAVAPGLIATAATAGRIAASTQFQNALVRRTPLGRVGTPSDIARAVAFLASEDASFITGQTLAVDGGWSTTHFLAA